MHRVQKRGSIRGLLLSGDTSEELWPGVKETSKTEMKMNGFLEQGSSPTSASLEVFSSQD